MTPRERSREAAFQILFSLGTSLSDDSVESAFETHCDHFDIPHNLRGFSKELVTGTLSKRSEIDQLIEGSASHWKLGRVGMIEKTILRLALYEMKFLGTPKQIVIDQAVEIAKTFGSKETSAYVNGVLDGCAPE